MAAQTQHRHTDKHAKTNDSNARLRVHVWASIRDRLGDGGAKVKELAALILIDTPKIVAGGKTEIVKVPMSQGDTGRWLEAFAREGLIVAQYHREGTRYSLAREQQPQEPAQEGTAPRHERRRQAREMGKNWKPLSGEKGAK